MDGTIRIARILGIPIEIHFSWLIVFGLIAWTLAAGYFPRAGPDLSGAGAVTLAIIATVLFFAALLLHELAHSYVALREGLPVRGITLFIFGGVAQMTREPRTAGAEFRMAIAGPATSIAIGLLFGALFFLVSWPPLVLLFQYLALINLIVALFNLVPAFPLDGGRVLRAAVWYYTGSLARATRIASAAGQGFAYFFMGFGLFRLFGGNAVGGVWMLFIGWFLLQAAQSSYQQLLIRNALRGVPVRDVMREQIDFVRPALTLAQFVDQFLLAGPASEFCVIDGGRLTGMVTLDDIRRVPRARWEEVRVGEVMQREADCPTVVPSQSAYQAFMLLAREGASQVVVREDARLVGVVTRQDLLGYIRNRLALEV